MTAIFDSPVHLPAYAKDTTWPHHRAGQKKRKREFRQRGQKRKRKR